jgi:uncharacterized protein DUF3137
VSANRERVDALYEQTLLPRIAALEDLRLSTKRYIVRGGLFVGVPVAIFLLRGFISLILPPPLSTALPIVSFVAIFVGVAVAGMRYLLPGLTAYSNYVARFKQEVVSEIFTLVCPTATYSPYQGIASEIFDGCGIFNTSGKYESDDLVRGRIGQTAFTAAETKRSYTRGSGKDSKTYIVFHGLFFHFDFNKTLRGVTIVEPEGTLTYQTGSRTNLHAVSLEDPEFETSFRVYASNEVEARYVLTPAMMERLLAVRAEAGKPIFLAFRDNGAYLGINYDRSLFEPSIANTTSKAAILEMASHFDLADVIVSELDLNTRIWTKDVDEAVLQEPEQPANPIMELAAAKHGALTENDLWAHAKISIGDEYDQEIGTPVAKPAATRVRVDSPGNGRTTVRYGWSFGLIISYIVSLTAAAIAVSALHQIASTPFAAGFAPLLDRIPTVPALDRLVGNNGIVWLPFTGVAALLFGLAQLVRVRRVVVTPDAILVYRGIKPFPRRYHRPEYNGILCLKNSVHLSKGAGVTLFNPTASPNLSERDAEWIAYELRRALQPPAAVSA